MPARGQQPVAEADPAVRARLAKLDIEPAYAPAGALRKKLDNEITNWTKFIDQKGLPGTKTPGYLQGLYYALELGAVRRLRR